MPTTRKKKKDGRAILHVWVDPVLRRRFKAAVELEGLTIEKKVENLMKQTIDAVLPAAAS
ncbi:MAG: hypothetical protein P4L84_11275 [Isosphaeraceae bacterium]|nr:hypothetical protein [Isosphaeraceae bacterium]